MNRRHFLTLGGLTAAGLLTAGKTQGALINEARKNTKIKPIAGSWFEFQHLNIEEGLYWDPALKSFTAEQWKAKVWEIKEIGMEYLVLMGIAAFGKAFYPTKLAPKFELNCEDPLEAVLSAADEAGIKFFVSNDFWGDGRNPEKMMRDPEIRKIRQQAMEEVAARYSHHKSFYGWYFPNEAYLHPYLDEFFVDYVNDCARSAKQLTPDCVNLIAPYNIKAEKSDDGYVKQLERMNIEIVAYQDGVGVNSTKLGEPARYFEHLHAAHEKAARSRIWADMELFYFEDKTKGNLLPADFNTRILKQMEDLSPFVDKILCYQYIGIMNKPGSTAFAGVKETTRLYNQYKKWLGNQKA
ncbi:DUF4434 domain-containing protein [Chitinophaga parva]|uniref:DUF4434 domain-containing protein n=1 Tax=Chitinophaga parva TaxID=2169414 RepID=A0A2T7BNT5_9BACT|nr:DUF4434 domain-containing protein [Chitinophaga parva]PUZ29281.1 DUF4434 domain-containing protein [Chitinophaga parva]